MRQIRAAAKMRCSWPTPRHLRRRHLHRHRRPTAHGCRGVAGHGQRGRRRGGLPHRAARREARVRAAGGGILRAAPHRGRQGPGPFRGVPRSMYFEWRTRRVAAICSSSSARPSHPFEARRRQILTFAQQCGVSRIFTFAAMATQLHPSQTPRAFGVATHEWMLPQLHEYEVGAAPAGADRRTQRPAAGHRLADRAACRLSARRVAVLRGRRAEPAGFPGRAQGVLPAVRCRGRLLPHSRGGPREVERALLQLLEQLKRAARQARGEPEEGEAFEPSGADEDPDESDLEEAPPPPAPRSRLSDEDVARIEGLFEEAQRDRENAFHLKEESGSPRRLRSLRGPLPRPVQARRVASGRAAR